MNLVIVGNGFDRNHCLKSAYCQYRCYLKKYFPKLIEKFEKFPWVNKEGSLDLWRDVEISLKLKFDDMKNYIEKNYLGSQKVTVEDLAELETDFEELTRFMYSFTGECFYKWLILIDKSKLYKKPMISKILENSVCVTFNYTDTLENLYNIDDERVYHLHGDLSKVVDSSCFSESIIPDFSTIEEAELYSKPLLESDKWNSDIIREEIQFGAPLTESNGIERIKKLFSEKADEDLLEKLSLFIDKTVKDLSANIENLKLFLKGKDVDDVYIMGISLNGPDDYYFEECFVDMYKTKNWHFFWHKDKSETENFVKKYDFKKVFYYEW